MGVINSILLLLGIFVLIDLVYFSFLPFRQYEFVRSTFYDAINYRSFLFSNKLRSKRIEFVGRS
jgi:hypothetical protein